MTNLIKWSEMSRKLSGSDNSIRPNTNTKHQTPKTMNRNGSTISEVRRELRKYNLSELNVLHTQREIAKMFNCSRTMVQKETKRQRDLNVTNFSFDNIKKESKESKESRYIIEVMKEDNRSFGSNAFLKLKSSEVYKRLMG